MSKAKVTDSKKSGLRIPGFAQLQRLGKSLMLPIAVLPAAGLLLRLGQDDLLGGVWAPFQILSLAGGAIFDNLAMLTSPGARSRVGEVATTERALNGLASDGIALELARISPLGTWTAGTCSRSGGPRTSAPARAPMTPALPNCVP